MSRVREIKNCHVCGSDRLVHKGRLAVTKLSFLGIDYIRLLEPFRNIVLFFLPRAERVHNAVCLDCGTIRLYVVDTSIYDR